MSERERRIKICESIGCSGVDKFCPGNLICTILRKVLIGEKNYTRADLEQAHKQGSEEERARCIKAVHKIDTDPEFVFNYRSGFYGGRRCAEVAIEDLGPIGETREETEKRVRRDTIDKIRSSGKIHVSPNGVPAYIILVDVLDAIAEGR